MSARSLDTSTYVEPGHVPLGQPPGVDDQLLGLIETLSVNGVDRSTASIAGYYYLPLIPSDSPQSACDDPARFPITGNVSFPTSPPPGNADLIGIAPVQSSECILARFQSSNSLVKAFIIYMPNDGQNAAPPADYPVWNFDNDGQWRTQYDFPVYAVPSGVGADILEKLSMYSGNLSSLPNADAVRKAIPENATVRLWGQVNLNVQSQSPLPSLWVFLLAILGVLALIIGSTSSFMHFMQHRRRNQLRSRILAGEVDTEALGVKRGTVSQQTIDALPIQTYNPDALNGDDSASSVPLPPATESSDSKSGAAADDDILAAATSSRLPTSIEIERPHSLGSSAPLHSATHNTCAICLDEFEPFMTELRILPCNHAFHPECIDPFLLSSSSLCPLCKRSVLPQTSCPPVITNAMVRRERMMRRAEDQGRSATGIRRLGLTARDLAPNRAGGVPRQRFLSSSNDPESHELRSRSMFDVLPTRRIRQFGRRMSMRPSEQAGQSRQGTDIEMQDQQEMRAPDRATTAHREWARRRASVLLRHRSAEDPDLEAATQPLPRWRQILSKVFPTLG